MAAFFILDENKRPLYLGFAKIGLRWHGARCHWRSILVSKNAIGGHFGFWLPLEVDFGSTRVANGGRFCLMRVGLICSLLHGCFATKIFCSQKCWFVAGQGSPRRATGCSVSCPRSGLCPSEPVHAPLGESTGCARSHKGRLGHIGQKDGALAALSGARSRPWLLGFSAARCLYIRVYPLCAVRRGDPTGALPARGTSRPR